MQWLRCGTVGYVNGRMIQHLMNGCLMCWWQRFFMKWYGRVEWVVVEVEIRTLDECEKIVAKT